MNFLRFKFIEMWPGPKFYPNLSLNEESLFDAKGIRFQILVYKNENPADLNLGMDFVRIRPELELDTNPN